MFRCQAVSRRTRQHPYSPRSRPSTALVARDLEETLSVAVKRRPRHTETGIELPRTDGRTVAARRFRSLVEASKQSSAASCPKSIRARRTGSGVAGCDAREHGGGIDRDVTIHIAVAAA